METSPDSIAKAEKVEGKKPARHQGGWPAEPRRDGPNISGHRDENRAKCLPPQPEAGPARLLREVANETLVNAEAIHQPDCRRGQIHVVVPPCSSGKPRHNLVSARRASRTSRRP